MSRGWESKSVESQQADQPEAPLSGAEKTAKAAEVRGNMASDAERKRLRQALEMPRRWRTRWRILRRGWRSWGGRCTCRAIVRQLELKLPAAQVRDLQVKL